MALDVRNPNRAGTRDGFTSEYGRFYVDHGRVERVEGSSLREMFLPRQSREGQRMRDKIHDFIPGQLKHYGISFEGHDLLGRRELTFFKNVLEDGKCDKVPDYLSQLRDQLHSEWLTTLTPCDLSDHPEWTMEKYFLSSGQPDHKKTMDVVGIPFKPHSQYRAGKMREAAGLVAGLHHATGWGLTTQTIYLGWDAAAVSKAAKHHAENEANETQAAARAREAERTAAHNDYLRGIKGKKSAKTPVGSYMVDCQYIEKDWPDNAGEMTIEIRQADEPGIFRATFDFGIIEGVMIMGADDEVVTQHCTELERDEWKNYYGDGEEEDEDEVEDEVDDEDEDLVKDENDKPTNSAKRKANSPPKTRGRPPKKPKTPSITTRTTTRTYHVRLRGRENGEGEICSLAAKGSIQFKGANMASFTGKADLPFIGNGVVFTARKTSDATPFGQGDQWEYYSEAAYESARIGRWH